MSPISSGSGPASSEAMSSKDVLLLKKTQDLAKSQAAQLLSAIPTPAANPQGVGMQVDLVA